MTALDAVGSVRISGAWWRQVPARASTPEPSHRPQPDADGRWQRGAVVAGLHLADSADAAWAEWYRHLAASGRPPAFATPRFIPRGLRT